ncbi:zinc finger protein 608, partial [Nephila pilipes]
IKIFSKMKKKIFAFIHIV